MEKEGVVLGRTEQGEKWECTSPPVLVLIHFVSGLFRTPRYTFPGEALSVECTKPCRTLFYPFKRQLYFP